MQYKYFLTIQLTGGDDERGYAYRKQAKRLYDDLKDTVFRNDTQPMVYILTLKENERAKKQRYDEEKKQRYETLDDSFREDREVRFFNDIYAVESYYVTPKEPGCCCQASGFEPIGTQS